jgi:dethiobiotin synthetase
MSSAYFITGTDTACGKTLVANALLKAAAARGHSTLGLKPVAAGSYLRDGIQVNEDAWELLQNTTLGIDYAAINPITLREPMAPHIAAEREGRAFGAADLAAHCRPLLSQAEFAVVEGAGGWQVPLNESESMVDIATLLDIPVLLVVGMRLGCINHALLTAAAIRSAGLHLAGWIANHIDDDMAVANENVASLHARLEAPLVGRIPWMESANAVQAARHLDLDQLR